jgi:hypothetical protein
VSLFCFVFGVLPFDAEEGAIEPLFERIQTQALPLPSVGFDDGGGLALDDEAAGSGGEDAALGPAFSSELAELLRDQLLVKDPTARTPLETLLESAAWLQRYRAPKSE